MPWHARAGGSWRNITNPSVRVAGAWRSATNAYVRVAGVWQQFFTALTVAITNQSISSLGSANPAAAGYSLVNNGDIQSRENFSPTVIGQWVTPPGGFSSYEARCTVTGGGGGTFSGTTGTWTSLSASQTWELSSSISATLYTRTLLIEIRDATTLAVLTSATITLSVEAL